jgi:pilus assembly protein CpaE
MIPHISIRAFVQTPTAKAAVEGAMVDRHLVHAQGAISSGGIGAAVAHHRQHPTPDVLIVEAGENILSELSTLADVCDPQTRVVVIGHSNDVTLYKCVIQQGVSEYLVAPVDTAALVASVCGLYANGRAANRGSTYAFISARGGAGSSMISRSVAWLMSEHEAKPAMFADLDMGFGSAFLALDVQVQHKLTEVFKDPAKMDAALLERLLAPRGKHLRVLAPSAALVEDELSAEATRRLIELGRDSFRRTVLDLPARWTPAVKEALRLADDVVITAEPDLVSLRNTSAILDFLTRARPNDPPPKLVLNQTGRCKRRELAPGAFADALKFTPSVILKYDAEVFGKAENQGLTLAESAARSATTRALTQFAQSLMKSETPAKPARRYLFWRRP